MELCSAGTVTIKNDYETDQKNFKFSEGVCDTLCDHCCQCGKPKIRHCKTDLNEPFALCENCHTEIDTEARNM